MTPFKKQQHKYVLLLGIPLIILIIVLFYSRLVAYYSEPLYLEGEVSQCEFKKFKDSRSVYLTINETRYDYSRPASAYTAVKNICEKQGVVGIYYHRLSILFFGNETWKIRELVDPGTGKVIFSRSHYYDYESTQVISVYLLLLVFIPGVLFSFFVMLGWFDDDSISAFKSQYKQNRGVIRVRSGEGLIDGIFMVLVGFGVFFFSLYKISSEGFSWSVLFMMPLGVVGYVYLVGIVNYRYVRVANNLLQVKKGPLPQLNSLIDINVNNIEEIYCDYEVNRSRHGSSEVISVIAGLKEDVDDVKDIILFFTSTYEEAQAITDTLNDLLDKNYK
ncbi:MAG: hypothetical protein OEY78_05615 [Gammaproteobacteria bacterium]|nr:hypothetical protein [Gammaproteobacteria bacterium]